MNLNTQMPSGNDVTYRIIEQPVFSLSTCAYSSAHLYFAGMETTTYQVRSLMRLDVYVQAAIACGINSKGPWRSAKTPVFN